MGTLAIFFAPVISEAADIDILCEKEISLRKSTKVDENLSPKGGTRINWF